MLLRPQMADPIEIPAQRAENQEPERVLNSPSPMQPEILQQPIPPSGSTTTKSATSVLEGLGLLRPKSAAPPTTPEILERNDLTVAATLEQLGDLIKTSQSESIRIQAIKMLMEMHQLLKPQIANGGLIVSINILDSEAPKGLNPILIPRPEASILDMSILPQNVENHAV